MNLRALSLLLSLVAAGTANARERVAIAAFNIVGAPLAPSAQKSLHASLRGGLATGGFEIVDEKEVARALSDSPGLAGCDTVTCLRRLAELVGTERLVKASVEVLGTATYSIAVELVSDGRTVARVDDSCQVCTFSEASDALSSAATALSSRTPTDLHLAPHATTRRVTQGPTSVAPHSRRMRVAAWSAAALGLLTLASGIALAAVDPITTAGIDAQGNQTRDQHGTLGAGIGLTIAGAALGGVAGILFWRDHVSRRGALAVIPMFARSGAGLEAVATF